MNCFTSNLGSLQSPKIYFNDVGLAAYLLGIETSDQLYRDPLRGGLYENWVILEIFKAYLNRGKRLELFFLQGHAWQRSRLGNKASKTSDPN